MQKTTRLRISNSIRNVFRTLSPFLNKWLMTYPTSSLMSTMSFFCRHIYGFFFPTFLRSCALMVRVHVRRFHVLFCTTSMCRVLWLFVMERSMSPLLALCAFPPWMGGTSLCSCFVLRIWTDVMSSSGVIGSLLSLSDAPVEDRPIPVLSTSSTTLSNEDSAFAAFSAFDAGLNPAKILNRRKLIRKEQGRERRRRKSIESFCTLRIVSNLYYHRDRRIQCRMFALY
jgi:hypothetical protein